MSVQKLFVLFIAIISGTSSVLLVDNAIHQPQDEVRVNGESW